MKEEEEAAVPEETVKEEESSIPEESMKEETQEESIETEAPTAEKPEEKETREVSNMQMGIALATVGCLFLMSLFNYCPVWSKP